MGQSCSAEGTCEGHQGGSCNVGSSPCSACTKVSSPGKLHGKDVSTWKTMFKVVGVADSAFAPSPTPVPVPATCSFTSASGTNPYVEGSFTADANSAIDADPTGTEYMSSDYSSYWIGDLGSVYTITSVDTIWSRCLCNSENSATISVSKDGSTWETFAMIGGFRAWGTTAQKSASGSAVGRYIRVSPQPNADEVQAWGLRDVSVGSCSTPR
jgi:hypothetical protein